ncbi:hypothetical protein Pcaca01_20300 [Pectobacterium carotovorum subsp. carotovorum]|nr:hypothetical protein Pcaca01_20300 [Pectobacterium carotovorum subsp. carotovorum]
MTADGTACGTKSCVLTVHSAPENALVQAWVLNMDSGEEYVCIWRRSAADAVRCHRERVE